jgi:hypothetical protein
MSTVTFVLKRVPQRLQKGPQKREEKLPSAKTTRLVKNLDALLCVYIHTTSIHSERACKAADHPSFDLSFPVLPLSEPEAPAIDHQRCIETLCSIASCLSSREGDTPLDART